MYSVIKYVCGKHHIDVCRNGTLTEDANANFSTVRALFQSKACNDCEKKWKDKRMGNFIKH